MLIAKGKEEKKVWNHDLVQKMRDGGPSRGIDASPSHFLQVGLTCSSSLRATIGQLPTGGSRRALVNLLASITRMTFQHPLDGAATRAFGVAHAFDLHHHATRQVAILRFADIMHDCVS